MYLRYGSLFGLICLCATHLMAIMPKGAVVIEGEVLKPENNAWEVKDHWDNWYHGHPSGTRMLSGGSQVLGAASTTFTVPEAGTYYVWVRYLDQAQRQGETGAFTVTVAQDGKAVGEGTLNKATLRDTEEGKKKWGEGWGQFVWQRVAFTAEKGEATLSLSKPAAVQGPRHVDLFIITSDEQYEGDVRDAHPVFIKVNILPEQDKPCTIEIGGRRSTHAYPGLYVYLLGLGIHRDGIATDYQVFDTTKYAKLNPGDSTPWLPLYKLLTFHRADMVSLSAMEGRNKPLPNAAFEVLLSTTPDDSGIVLRETRRGIGSGLIVNINLVTGKLLTDREGSAQSLEWAKATQPVGGVRPMLFPFSSGMRLEAELSQPEYIERELEALKIIGVNGLARSRIVHPDFPHQKDARFMWHLAKTQWCQNDPNTEVIEKYLKDYADLHAQKPCFALDLMDEPSFEVSHIVNCDICTAAFQKYAAKHGVKMDGKPVFDPNSDDPVRYYWSRRFQCSSMVEYFRVGTTAVQKHIPGLPTTSNFSTELIFEGDMVQRGTDWWEILRSGALTYGLTEDWNNFSATFQTVSYQTATLRAACRPRGYKYGMYNIIDGRCAWDIAAKGFCQIGHGIHSMVLYDYGPYYAPTCDAASHREEIYQGIKNLTWPTGGVEKHLTNPAAKVAKGDIAMLVGATSDIWSNPKETGNAYGRERIYLNLLLTHCGYRIDILNEDDLATELKNYSVLFVTDSHLHTTRLKALTDWVRTGGTLYLGAGALQFDEYNRPLGADKALGITREPINLVEKAGIVALDLCRRKPLKDKDVAGMPIYVGLQEPCNKVFTAGRGKVLFSGFFPGLSYIASSKKDVQEADASDAFNLGALGGNIQINSDVYSARAFEPVYRSYIKGLGLPVQPRLLSGNPLVEAGLIEAPQADVIVLSNWTGEPQTITVTLNAPSRYNDRAIEVIGGTKLDAKRERNALTVKLTLNAGCYVLLPKR